jgi:hypothetical protein
MMAISLAIMATIQIGLILVGLKVARQMNATVEDLRREIRPLVEKLNRVADDASRATALAVVQVERVDAFMSNTVARVDEAVGIIGNAMGGPIRQGVAAVTAFRAVFEAFRSWQGRNDQRKRGGRTRDDEDALFVG